MILLMIYSEPNFLRQAGYAAKLENQKLKHSFASLHFGNTLVGGSCYWS